MSTKGFLEADGKFFLVGGKDSGRRPEYRGPTARISYDETWLHIVTDDYEGHAMLNIEALPHLRRALAKIAKALHGQGREEGK